MPPPLKDIIQWEVRTWSRALPLWERHLPRHRPVEALGIGEREGGLSSWLAAMGVRVVCTDLRDLPPATRALHEHHGVQDRVTYAHADAMALPFADSSFDIVFFKSVLGALGAREKQRTALREMYRVLRPGGVLLFAENLAGSPLHAFFRRRFVRWATYWRYLRWPDDGDLFEPFEQLQVGTTGFLAPLGRSEAQRDLLARLDPPLTKLLPARWRTVVFGALRKP